MGNTRFYWGQFMGGLAALSNPPRASPPPPPHCSTHIRSALADRRIHSRFSRNAKPLLASLCLTLTFIYIVDARGWTPESIKSHGSLSLWINIYGLISPARRSIMLRGLALSFSVGFVYSSRMRCGWFCYACFEFCFWWSLLIFWIVI